MNDEPETGVVKMGLFFSEYLEGVPNSKIFALSQGIYDSMSADFKELLDHEATTLSELDKDHVKKLHESLVKKDYNQVREIVKESVVQGKGAQPETSDEVPKNVFVTMHQDPDHDFASNEKVAVKRSDGRITYGYVYLIVENKIVVVVSDGYLKSVNRDVIWHF